MSISQVVVYFMFYSFVGWLWEMVYTPIEYKYFENRGFFFGPICPIYGFSILLLQFLIRNVPFFTSESMTLPKLFFICMFGSAIVEYTTSWSMETLFHARWWDYSNFPLNINGRICLPASVFFGIAGVMLVHYVFPAMDQVSSYIPDAAFETAALVLAAVFGADYALTNASLTSLLEKIETVNKEFTEKGESVYQAMAATPGQLKKRIIDYETETREKARAVAESLSGPQKYLMARITKFSDSFELQKKNYTKANMGNRIKEYLTNIRYTQKNNKD